MKSRKFKTKAQNAEDSRLDLDTCKRMINVGENSYSDREIIVICDFLYQLAEIECRYFKQWQTEQRDLLMSKM